MTSFSVFSFVLVETWNKYSWTRRTTSICKEFSTNNQIQSDQLIDRFPPRKQTSTGTFEKVDWRETFDDSTRQRSLRLEQKCVEFVLLSAKFRFDSKSSKIHSKTNSTSLTTSSNRVNGRILPWTKRNVFVFCSSSSSNSQKSLTIQLNRQKTTDFDLVRFVEELWPFDSYRYRKSERCDPHRQNCLRQRETIDLTKKKTHYEPAIFSPIVPQPRTAIRTIFSSFCLSIDRSVKIQGETTNKFLSHWFFTYPP